MNSAYGSFVNRVGVGNIYPGGGSLGQEASAQTPDSASQTADTKQGAPAASSRLTAMGQPVTWWVVLLLMLVGLMALAQKLGQDDEFGNVRMSVYNVLTISIASIIGITFFKAVFGRFKVPGLSTLVIAV